MDKIPALEKQELLSKYELSIWLDDYDNIFSDFDPRPIKERSLSDDFLVEVSKRVREKDSGNVQLKLLIPGNKRDQNIEAVIIKNLHSYFRHAAALIEEEMKASRRRGGLLSILGFLLMIATAYVVSISNRSFFFKALQIVLEPSGWFLVWTGMDNIIYNARKQRPRLKYNSQLAHAEIIFLNY